MGKMKEMSIEQKEANEKELLKEDLYRLITDTKEGNFHMIHMFVKTMTSEWIARVIMGLCERVIRAEKYERDKSYTYNVRIMELERRLDELDKELDRDSSPW